MSFGLALFALILVAYVIVTFVLNIRRRRTLQEIGSNRPSVTKEDFIASLMNSGAPQSLAEATHKEAVFYYYGWLTPHPDDDPINGFLEVDPDDFDDIVAVLWKIAGLPEPSRTDPVSVPAGLTWRSLAIWVSEQRVLRVPS